MKKVLFTFFLLLLLLFPLKAGAQGTSEKILSFISNITINQDSSVNVTETINYYFPTARHGIYRYIPYRYQDDRNNKYFKTPITNVSVTDKNLVAYQFSQSHEKNNLLLKIGDPDKTITGEHTYIISYKVTGVINYFDNHDELYWNVTGNDWSVPIENVEANVTLPSAVEESSVLQQCYTGSFGSTAQDCVKSFTNGVANFSTKEGPLTIVLGWNKGIVAEIARDYELTLRHESGWFWIVPLLAFIYLLFTYFRKGKDPFGRGTIAPEFDTPENLLPAEIGTLIDEKVDNKDVSSTIVDLAVKGYLKIRKEDTGYSLVKVKEADNKLKEYETLLFNALLSGKKETDLSEIHINDELKGVRESLYQDMMNKKYFDKNPQKVRNDYLLWGILIIFFCGIFFWLSWNLVSALMITGIIVLIFSKFMPKKTKEGVILKEKSLGFKEFLYRADRYKLKWQEKEHIFEKFLPYAMVLGVADQWAKNFKDIYKEPPDWYDGSFTTFNTVIFASEISRFSSQASSAYSPPAASGSSGFGGGSSGGGFGGGGGGSW